MKHYDFRAILDIRVTGDAESKKEALESAIQNATYQVIAGRMNNSEPIKYISTVEFAKKHGLSGSSNAYIGSLCAKGIIPGAIKVGNTYGIPENAPYIDRRITDGKYVGNYEKYGRKQYEARKARRAAGLPETSPRKPPDNPIALARYEKGMTQKELANAIGASVFMVQSWEIERCKPSKQMLEKVADVLGVEMDTFASIATQTVHDGPITRARLKRGWTVAQLSEASGVNKETLSRLERGMYRPQQKTLERLAEALEMDIDDLREDR